MLASRGRQRKQFLYAKSMSHRVAPQLYDFHIAKSVATRYLYANERPRPRPRLLHEDATDRLRDMIVQGELAPGTR